MEATDDLEIADLAGVGTARSTGYTIAGREG